MQASNLRIPALIVSILGWIVVGTTLIAGLSLSYWLISYTQFAESSIVAAIGGIAIFASLLVWPLSVLAVLIWVYMAHSNLHREGLSGLNYSPAWAAISFFVPIANLFVPFRAMRELANRSAGEPEELADADVQDVISWWGCWLGSLVMGTVLIYMLLVEIVPWLWMTTPFWANQVILILFNLFSAGSAFFLVKSVRQISKNQQDGMGVAAAFE